MRTRTSGKRPRVNRITNEGHILEEIIANYVIKPSVTDFGARLQGSNSWHLVNNHDFHGVLVEKNPKSCEKLRNHVPNAEVHAELVTLENCNDFVNDDTGILCIDIDGNDYHIWKAIKASPDVVVIEFGRKKSIKRKNGEVDDLWIPEYIEESPKRFDGASEEALMNLAKTKGYRLYGKNSVNLIFLHERLHSTAKAS